MKSIEERLAQVEARLERIERLLPVEPVAASARAAQPAEAAEPLVIEPQASIEAAASPETARRVIDPMYGTATPHHRHHGSTL